MSELTLNVTPSPELLKPAASDQARPVPADAARAPDPFATLLAGVLQGAQPPAAGAPGPAATGNFTELLGPTEPGDTTLLALPGAAPPLPGSLPAAPVAPPAGLAGNGLPAGGKELPLPLAAGSTGVTQAAPAPANPAAEADTTPAIPDRPRIFLGDLAQSRPLQPATDLPAAGGLDGARSAAVAALAARPPASGSRTAASGLAAPGAARPVELPGVLDARGLGLPTITEAGTLPAAADALSLRSPVAGLPVAGTELLAGQLAAFAAGGDNTSTPTGTASLTTTSTGTGLADAGSAALLGRLGSTGMPALQPLGDSGAFASGLADRLLTLGGPGAHSARLKLHPEHLGELDVEITMDDGTAQVWFGTTTSQARDAIEGSLPKLREMFADQGIELTRTQIDAGSGQQGQSAFGQERRMAGGAGAWNDIPAWQPARPAASAGPAGGTASLASTRLLDVWA